MQFIAHCRTILFLAVAAVLAGACGVRSVPPAPDAPLPAEPERAQQPSIQRRNEAPRQAPRPTVWSATERQAYIEELERWVYSREFRDGSYRCIRRDPKTKETMPYVCGTILFGLQAGLRARDVADLIRAVSGEVMRDTSDDWGGLNIRVASGKEKEAIIRLLRDPRVRYAEMVMDYPIKFGNSWTGPLISGFAASNRCIHSSLWRIFWRLRYLQRQQQ